MGVFMIGKILSLKMKRSKKPMIIHSIPAKFPSKKVMLLFFTFHSS